MFIDARTIARDAVVQAGVCIIGAGAAGITLALSLRDSGFPVVVLESGDLDFDADTQNLDAGIVAAQSNYPLDVSRLRFFGGTTNHWDGWCRPLDALDFVRRPAIPLSGWPLQKPALIPYYEQAQHICELGPFEYDPGFWVNQTGQTEPNFDPVRLKIAMIQVSPPTRFGQAYREALRRSVNVTTYLNANAVDLQANPTVSAVELIKVATIGGPTFSVRARYVVLATGGLENARILLLSNRIQPAGLGNTYDLVGRYFMDHPWIRQAAVVRFAAPDPSLPLFFDETRLSETTVFATLAPGEAALTRLPTDPTATGGFRIVMQKLHRVISGVDAFKSVFGALSGFSLPANLWDDLGSILHDRDALADALYRAVTRRRTSPFPPVMPSAGPVVGALLDINIEQTPNPASRVMLSQERDALGQNRLVLFWRLTEMERRTYRRAQELAALEFGRLGIGRVNARPLPDDGWPADMFGSRHHMGTTRMSDDPKTGVVDADCRVHGLSNLYIAGSSVFPTSGYANPTLTIVALALRLGDELRRRMMS
jgi:choline dehydrogenase-like flavoprotein